VSFLQLRGSRQCFRPIVSYEDFWLGHHEKGAAALQKQKSGKSGLSTNVRSQTKDGVSLTFTVDRQSRF